MHSCIILKLRLVYSIHRMHFGGEMLRVAYKTNFQINIFLNNSREKGIVKNKEGNSRKRMPVKGSCADTKEMSSGKNRKGCQ